MAYRLWEVILGGVVLLVAVGFVALALGSTGTSLTQQRGYPLHATFRSAEGVRLGTEVRLAGVRIGSVTALSLDPNDFRARLTISVDPALALPVDSTIQIASEGILGGTFVEVLPGGDLDTLVAGDSFNDTQSAVSLITLLLRAFTSSEAEDPS